MGSLVDYLLGPRARGPATTSLAGPAREDAGAWAQNMKRMLDQRQPVGGYGLLAAQARRNARVPSDYNRSGDDSHNVSHLERAPYPGEDKYFKQNPNVGGMATEDGKIILNPYSSLSAEEKRAVAVNEMARLKMQSGDIDRPAFDMTPDQSDFFQTIKRGSPYGSQQDIRETIVGRILSGDPSAGNVTQPQRAYVDKLRGLLDAVPEDDRRNGRLARRLMNR